MAIRFNHTLVHKHRDRKKSATFLAEILGLPPRTLRHFTVRARWSGERRLDFLDARQRAVRTRRTRS